MTSSTLAKLFVALTTFAIFAIFATPIQSISLEVDDKTDFDLSLEKLRQVSQELSAKRPEKVWDHFFTPQVTTAELAKLVKPVSVYLSTLTYPPRKTNYWNDYGYYYESLSASELKKLFAELYSTQTESTLNSNPKPTLSYDGSLKLADIEVGNLQYPTIDYSPYLDCSNYNHFNERGLPPVYTKTKTADESLPTLPIEEEKQVSCQNGGKPVQGKCQCTSKFGGESCELVNDFVKVVQFFDSRKLFLADASTDFDDLYLDDFKRIYFKDLLIMLGDISNLHIEITYVGPVVNLPIDLVHFDDSSAIQVEFEIYSFPQDLFSAADKFMELQSTIADPYSWFNSIYEAGSLLSTLQLFPVDAVETVEKTEAVEDAVISLEKLSSQPTLSPEIASSSTDGDKSFETCQNGGKRVQKKCQCLAKFSGQSCELANDVANDVIKVLQIFDRDKLSLVGLDDFDDFEELYSIHLPLLLGLSSSSTSRVAITYVGPVTSSDNANGNDKLKSMTQMQVEFEIYSSPQDSPSPSWFDAFAHLKNQFEDRYSQFRLSYEYAHCLLSTTRIFLVETGEAADKVETAKTLEVVVVDATIPPSTLPTELKTLETLEILSSVPLIEFDDASIISNGNDTTTSETVETTEMAEQVVAVEEVQVQVQVQNSAWRIFGAILLSLILITLLLALIVCLVKLSRNPGPKPNLKEVGESDRDRDSNFRVEIQEKIANESNLLKSKLAPSLAQHNLPWVKEDIVINMP